MDRRTFIKSSTALVVATAVAEFPDFAASEPTSGVLDRRLRHRFGVNYVPSQNWYYCYNDWNASAIASDLDRIADLGADHFRVMVIWPWFQPNPAYVSPAHLDRLDRLMELAAERKLDVLPTIYTGWLSGYHFNPGYLENEPFYTSRKWAKVQTLYLEQIAARMQGHPNFLGFDIGNEINCNWQCSTSDGDSWMKHVFKRMYELCPAGVHVNGVDHQPWFSETVFSAEALVAQQPIVALHCWPYWTGAGQFGKPLDAPYVKLPAGMAALARSLGKAPAKPVWVEEFGACAREMPEADVPRWLEAAVLAAIDQGVAWFTWWASHDVDQRFQFSPFEYHLGLLTVDNRIKKQGRVFRRLAEAYRGKPVKMPANPPPPPPLQRNAKATWNWLLDWMGWKK